MDKLRIETIPAERQVSWCADAIAFTFEVDESGNVSMGEDWAKKDETWGYGVGIRIPARIWAIAAPWIADRICAKAQKGQSSYQLSP